MSRLRFHVRHLVDPRGSKLSHQWKNRRYFPPGDRLWLQDSDPVYVGRPIRIWPDFRTPGGDSQIDQLAVSRWLLGQEFDDGGELDFFGISHA